ncbi:MAG TPA: hypothetical protein VMU59_13850 [Caulobacteraceae bacterium]|nr:hypothetical protein [Caulobacteraceae bacterium]
MSALSQDRVGIVRALVEAAPDSAVRSLEAALRGESAGGTLSSVKSIVTQEMNDRLVRDAVLEPLMPLFSPRADGIEQLQFPKAAINTLWRALKQDRPDETAYAASLPARRYEEDATPPIYDELCVLAARGLRAGRGPFAEVGDLLRAYRPGADAELIAFLDLAPIGRRALRQLPAWIARSTEEQQAAARLMFKDAGVIAEDAGPRLMEILFAHLAEPWVVLRLMSALMLKPSDGFAAVSELADFGERFLRDIDSRLAALKAFDYDGGALAGRQAADALRMAAAIASEFEQALKVKRDGPWGERLAKQKQMLAAAAESHLKKTLKVIGEALPQQPVRSPGRASRLEPDLTAPPDPSAVRRAMALLHFFAGIRTVAAQSGYGVVRAKAQEEIAKGLDAYLEDLLQVLHEGDSEPMDHARQFLEIAADFTALVHDEKTAQIVRRRAAAA